MNKILIILGVLIVVGGGAFVLIKSTTTDYQADEAEVEVMDDEMMEVEANGGIGDGAESLDDLLEAEVGPVEIIGSSVEGRDITAYHFGEGEKEVLFVAGLHGGYSWNTSLLAYELVDYLESNPAAIPEGVKVTVIPAVNPDGLYDITGKEGLFAKNDVSGDDAARTAARFNANKVDLNRNFNCLWEEEGTWQSQSVSGGAKPFSEPEAVAVRDYVESHNPEAVVVYYAAAGGVYASNCKEGVLAETTTLTASYASAAGYSANAEFDFYEITGDMVNWLAAKKIPAISVLLTDKENTEWTENLKGIEAVLNQVAK
jgi:g-D-glutamyl-meso-diaminopimelate peptidase